MSNVEKEQVLITAQCEADRLTEQREEIAQTLAELVADIRTIQKDLRQGEVDRKSETGKLLGELRYWLRAARETEAELEIIRRKEAGIGDAYGIDLRAAELAVRCRLDSLRACCDTGRIPE
ncbi:MAG: hypothetical protein N4A61_05030 [Pelagimonas sp.]|jgi:hypothetical protein|nr:hypothetical protein [Pelagimonas sp.]